MEKKDISSVEVVSNNFNEITLKIKLAFEKNIKCPKCDNSLFILKSYHKRKEPIIFIKNDKLIKIFFTVPFICCKKCGVSFLDNKNLFYKKNVNYEIINILDFIEI